MTQKTLPHEWENMSGAAAYMGVRFVHWGPDETRFELDLQPHHMNRHGLPHGGVYAFMLDTAMGYCGAYTGDPEVRQNTLTLSMTVNFLSRPKGTRLIAEGNRVGGGAKTYFAEGRITDETGELIATSSGAFKMRSR